MRKEIRIIRIILSEIICFLKQHHFWSNYNNYSNFFPKTTIVILLVYKNFDCIGNLKISDCTTSGNMLFILCTLASSGTKYNNNCIIAKEGNGRYSLGYIGNMVIRYGFSIMWFIYS